jgi:hypothetical protein
MRNLPSFFECPIKSCSNHDVVGSENSCNGGSLYTCPIAQGFITDRDKEALEVGNIALNDNVNLSATRAYFLGKNRGK